MKKSFAAVLAVLFLFLVGSAFAEERTNWIPNNGSRVVENPLGDEWTFSCPRGGSFEASVDTIPNEEGESGIDPVAYVLGPDGTFMAGGDDQNLCTATPMCGYACPALRRTQCTDGGTYRLIVRDYGAATRTGRQCNTGGGYILSLKVYNQAGSELSPSVVNLGGDPLVGLLLSFFGVSGGRGGPLHDDAGVSSDIGFVSPSLPVGVASPSRTANPLDSFLQQRTAKGR